MVDKRLLQIGSGLEVGDVDAFDRQKLLGRDQDLSRDERSPTVAHGVTQP